MAVNQEDYFFTCESTFQPNPKGLGYELFECMDRYRHKIAQIEGETGKTQTFGTLLKRAIRLALRLKEKNLQKTDIITVCSYNHINASLPLIAASFINVRYSPLDPTFSTDELKYFFNMLKPKVLFIVPEIQEKVQLALTAAECDTEIILFDDSFEYYVEKHENEDYFKPISPDSIKETWAIHFSSGTTGTPKGICLSQYTLMGEMETLYPNNEAKGVSNIFNKEKTISNSADMLLLYYSTLYWITGTTALLIMTASGSTRLIYKKFDVDEFWEALHKYEVTHIYTAVPILTEVAQTSQVYKGNSLVMYKVSGCKVHAHHITNVRKLMPNVTVCQTYGLTEVGGCIACPHPEDININPTSCGSTNRSFSFKIVDPETNQILPLTEIGELRIKTPFIFNGYYNSDSSGVFDEDGWFKTRDIVRFDKDRNIYIIRRFEDFLMYKNHQLSSVFLEEIVMQHPAVKQAAIVGVHHEVDGEHPAAVVTLKSEADPEEIREFVDKRVNDTSKLRGGVKIVDHLPYTASGKFNRPLLRKMINSD